MILRPYQIQAVESIWHYFETQRGNPILALPTGTGKSLVIAGFIRSMFTQFPQSRVLLLTHVRELLEQNLERLLDLWKAAPAGIYSAGLGRREVAPITYAGIASVAKKAALIGHVDIVVIDECHLVSHRVDTMYGSLLTDLLAINPALKVIGLSATPYRLGLGALTEPGGIFTDTCFDLCSRDAFNGLLAEGYLAPLVPKRPRAELNVDAVGLRGGEFIPAELQKAVDKEKITYAALQELCEQAHNRKSWIIFSSGIEHSDHIADMLVDRFDIAAASIHSKVPSAERAENIAKFKAGELRCLVNNNVLTTGFDHPSIDCIGVLRPTNSPALWVQMLGRATRPHPGKKNALIMDFASNTRRLGPINDPVLPRNKKKSGLPGVAPVRLCGACNTYSHARAVFCEGCGIEFPANVKYQPTAASLTLIAGAGADPPLVETFTVDNVVYSKHAKPGRPLSLRVTYHCGLRQFKEWVCLEHTGYALFRAHTWWRERGSNPPPATVEAAFERIKELRMPTSIRVWVNTKHPEVRGYDYTQDMNKQHEQHGTN